jgi:endonuclease/exonuclease/phosphatase family metal-dependent hydrolase
VPLLLRTWNVFHGNAVPTESRSFLRAGLALATADDPDVVLLQELPVAALRQLRRWTGYQAFWEVAARPQLGPLPSTASIGHHLTRLHSGTLRSAFSGQANAVLVAARHQAQAAGSMVLNPLRFRRIQARLLGLPVLARLAWAKERRVAHAVRITFADGRRATLTNIHATGSPDKRLPDAELLRAAWFADATARPEEVCVLGGDFNVRPEISRTLLDLCGSEWGFSEPASGIDHILVRGAESERAVVWQADRRRVDGRLLSDHTPVDVVVA